MNKFKLLITLLLIAGAIQLAMAKEKVINPGEEGIVDNSDTNVSLRNDCVESGSQTDLNINNVRARLLGGGDLWWDLTDGRYVIPNVQPGEREVSSIFAAALWIGGYDGAGNLKIAAQTYRQNGNDFWPGPINEDGTTEQSVCKQWDRHFEVRGKQIDSLVVDYLRDDDGDGLPDNIVNNEIPASLLRWPGRNNQFFEDEAEFPLPLDQDLAPFYDQNGDGDYNPYEGDIPIIGVRGCEASSVEKAPYADQMIWWVYNDIGNIHTETTGDQIGMEVQALAFSFATNNAINNMSFYKYTLLNKATSALDSTYIGQWVDPDLGCYLNDFVGCVVDESLGIVYNGKTIDQDCEGVNGYGTEVPMLGVDYFRGPNDEFGNELGMSAFIYYNNNVDPSNNPATTNPDEAQDFYGYLSGSWKDDTPVEFGGDGYGQGTYPTPYMFPDDPSSTDANAWSECSVDNNPDDRRFVQSSGPFTLNPGVTNEVIIGAVWVSDVAYPCPSFSKLLNADRVAQGLFDSCFDIVDGPDAPDISIIELDREIILTLSNSPGSNNANEDYFEFDPLIPPGYQDSVYNFQGYIIYQLAAPTVGCDNFNDCDDAKVIGVVDIKDGISTLVNYEPFDETPGIFVPNIKVQAGDNGINHSFQITSDLFATNDSRLVNNRKYYFTAVAYAHNDYVTFDPADFENTQQSPYLQGRRNIRTYTGIPHKNEPEDGTLINAQYGDAPEILRIDGEGMGSNFLELTPESINAICESGKEEQFTYQSNAGPFNVKVYDPLRLQGGTYTLRLVDTSEIAINTGALADSIFWTLEGNGLSISSDKYINSLNEQLIPDVGISISVQQAGEAFEDPTQTNGFLGATIEYADASAPEWYGALADDSFGFLSNFIKTSAGEPDEAKDPNKVYSDVLGGAWSPFYLTTAAPFTIVDGGQDFFITPRPDNSFISQQFNQGGGKRIRALPNVDIVLTSDKSKWSRCVVVNTFSEFYADTGIPMPNEDEDNFSVRTAPSVGKDGQPDNSGTGESWFPGYAINVETGERLYVFFGENTFYGSDFLPLPDPSGNDMIWNPSTFFAVSEQPASIAEFSFGAQHHVYVTTVPYNESENQVSDLRSSGLIFARGWSNVAWTSTPIPAVELNSIEDGLIPNDVTFKLRVNNPFQVTDKATTENGYPVYQFTIEDGLVATTGSTEVAEEALDLIRAVPNPYYGFSSYENDRFDQIIKITNLPPRCKVSIYTLDGRLIRTYNRNAQPDPARGADQLVTSQEWDMKNESGINVASGVYIIHIDASASGLGEKVIKWFGGVRDFDATGL